MVTRITEIQSKKPSNIRIKYSNLGLPSKQIETLLDNNSLRAYLEVFTDSDANLVTTAANYLTSDVVGHLTAGTLPALSLTEASIAGFKELVEMVAQGKITSRVAKDILLEALAGASPAALVAERGLSVNTDSDALKKIVHEVLSEQPQAVLEYKSGKVTAVQFLVGQGMKKSKGSSDPVTLRALFEEELKG